MQLDELYREAAAICRNLGIPADSDANGALAQWVRANCSYRPGTEFFIVLGIAGAIADMNAQSEGFTSNIDRAASAVKWGELS